MTHTLPVMLQHIINFNVDYWTFLDTVFMLNNLTSNIVDIFVGCIRIQVSSMRNILLTRQVSTLVVDFVIYMYQARH